MVEIECEGNVYHWPVSVLSAASWPGTVKTPPGVCVCVCVCVCVLHRGSNVLCVADKEGR